MRINGGRIKRRLRPNGKRKSISFSPSRPASPIPESGSRYFTRSSESWQTRRQSYRSSRATLFRARTSESETFRRARCSLTRCGTRRSFSSNNKDAFQASHYLFVLFTFDREIDCLRDVAANTEDIVSRGKGTQ